MNTRFLPYCLALFFLLFASLSHADKSQILGVYWFPDKDGQVEIVEQDGRFVGKVIAFDEPDQLDEKNPDPALRGQKFVGSLMFDGFTYNSKKQRWEDGTVYDGSEGKTYKCRLWFEGGDLSALKGRGYIGAPMFGRTATFERVDSAQK